jgi:hypothetical protein
MIRSIIGENILAVVKQISTMQAKCIMQRDVKDTSFMFIEGIEETSRSRTTTHNQIIFGCILKELLGCHHSKK